MIGVGMGRAFEKANNVNNEKLRLQTCVKRKRGEGNVHGVSCRSHRVREVVGVG